MSEHEDDAPPPPWFRLTVVDEKRAAFADDLYFRESWADVAAVLGDTATDLLHAVALLLLKPDAVVGRRSRTIVDYAQAHGFRPLGSAPLALTRHSMRALWQHDWHVYPIDRLAFSTLWYTSADILVLFFEDVVPHGSWPASLRLAQRKGHSLPARRRPDDLRSVLRPPNQILNFVHVADEPADIVRELGIFFDRRERRALLAALRDRHRHDALARVAAAIAAVEAHQPAHDLDFAASLARLERAGSLDTAGAERLRRLHGTGATVSWDGLCGLIDPYSPGVVRWDFISVAAHVIRYERGSAGLLPGVPTERW